MPRTPPAPRCSCSASGRLRPGTSNAPIEPDDEWRLLDADGHVRAFEATCSNLLEDPFVRGVVVTLHETTERRTLEEELKHLAFHDSLTQLPNRALFLDRVGHALSRQGRHRERLAVMLIDLDDFKLVNDTRGHAAGDALLVAVTERLTRACGRRTPVLGSGVTSSPCSWRVWASTRRPGGSPSGS